MASREEFEAIYVEFSDKIYRFLYWRTKDTHLAEDLTSEVFTKAYGSWDRFNGEYVQAWLYQIARNLLVDTYRKKKEISLNKIAEPSYDQELIEKIDKDLRIQELTKALETLSENLKEVVILRFIEEHSAKETAQILEISEVNVRVLSHRALTRLRGVLKDE